MKGRLKFAWIFRSNRFCIQFHLRFVINLHKAEENHCVRPLVKKVKGFLWNAVTPSPSPPLVVPLQEATPVVAKVSVLAALVGSVVTPPSTVITPLLSASVATTSAPVVSPPSFLALPSSSSRPRVFLDYLYTSSDADSLWGASYKPEQKTPTSFVSSFDENLIRSAGVQNATDSFSREVWQF